MLDIFQNAFIVSQQGWYDLGQLYAVQSYMRYMTRSSIKQFIGALFWSYLVQVISLVVIPDQRSFLSSHTLMITASFENVMINVAIIRAAFLRHT